MVLLAFIRAELLSFAAIPLVGGYLMFRYGEKYRDMSIALVKRRARLVKFIFLILALSVVVPLGYNFTLSQINNVGLSPAEVVEVASAARLERAADGEGGGSNYGDFETYSSYPWWARWAIQSVGMIVSPFPWQVNSIPRALAFVDSIILVLLIFQLVFSKHVLGNRSSVSFWFFITFLIGILIMGFIIINAGNAFRMRLAALPFLFVSYVIMLEKNDLILRISRGTFVSER